MSIFNTIKCIDTHVMRAEEKRENGTKNRIQRGQTFHIIGGKKNLQFSEAQQTPRRKNTEKITPRHSMLTAETRKPWKYSEVL